LTFTDFCDYVISERLKQHANNDDHDSCWSPSIINLTSFYQQ
jgi:hypothetical protein